MSRIHPARIQPLSGAPVRADGRYVLYWMQQSQRASFNPALEYAIEEANALDLPVVVAFGLTAFPEANARHYGFMLRGLAEVAQRLRKRGVGFVIRKARPDRLALELSREAALVVCDGGYLRVQRAWRAALAKEIDRRLVQVEADAVVPVETASPKHEVAARTLRPKIMSRWSEFVCELEPGAPRRAAEGVRLASDVDLTNITGVLASLHIDRSVGEAFRIAPGEGAARDQLTQFVSGGLDRYALDRARPEAQAVSHLSPYLHFGQISPVEVALRARESLAAPVSVAAYLEELVVRRELAFNHVFYEPQYDTFAALPAWARATLTAHAADPRPWLYHPDQFEAAETHDPVWNAAMREMRTTGYMHNRLRMYWGKKVLQWSHSPEVAFETLLRLNNRWFLDGRDPNSFTNVGWIFGLHDRPWAPQPVFGTVRAMGERSLKAFDAMAYVAQAQALWAGAPA